MSRSTEHIGLISTVSSTFYTPFHAARLVASLDHISKGRIGWNVVTSMFDAEARNHGYDAMPDHDWRYARAEEFIQVSWRSEEHTSELQSLMRISYAVFCLKKKINKYQTKVIK